MGLAFDQGPRLRVLAPIREYVSRQYPPKDEDLARAVDHYLELARKGDQVGREGGAEVVARLVQELGNLDSMISKGLERSDPEAAIWAAIDLGRLLRFSGWGSKDPLQRALLVTRSGGHQQLEADCIIRLGEIALERSDHDAARARYEEALPLYRSVGHRRGEAICIACLGIIALLRSDHDAARARFEEALPVFRNVGSVLGEANCIKGLGDIAFTRSDHDAACARYEEALRLYRNIDLVLGEANCIQSLGDIAFTRSDHDAARARYEEALPLFRNVGQVLGEANCIQGLGDLALLRSDHDAARDGFKEALHLYQRIQEPYSIGWTLVRLAQLEPAGSSERRSFVEAARKAWESIKRPDLVERLKDGFGEDFKVNGRGHR